VPDVEAIIIYRNNALGLIVQSALSQGYFECAVIDGFGVTRAEGSPDII